MRWIFEKDFLPGDHRLMAACNRLGFSVELVDRYSSAKITKEPIVFRGSIPFYLGLMKEQAVPGFYCSLPSFCCSKYYPFFQKFLLNKDYVLLPYGSLNSCFRWLEDKIGGGYAVGGLFVKPNSGCKQFTGKVIWNTKDLGTELKTEDLILIAPPKVIGKEWRFVVCNNKIISGSLYKPHEESDSESTHAGRFAESVIEYVKWWPDPVWTLDVCESNGKMYVLEINSFSCAGLYECDASKVVGAVSKQAEVDFKEYYE